MTAQAEAQQPAMPGLSVIIPANDEAETIGACLSAVLASDLPDDADVQVIVAANGCTDDTAARAGAFAPKAAARGWALEVLDLPLGSKPGALNAADARATGPVRVYLDADVIVSAGLLAQIGRALATDAPRWASGTVRIPRAQSRLTRAYARTYRRVPFMTQGVPGCGLFAVNTAGRARWGEFPRIIADDTFVRLQFAPQERIGVPAPYDWPLVEGWANLVKVRRRQDAGVAEIAARFPELLPRDDKPALGAAGMARLALSDPAGFAVYAGVALAVRATRHRRHGWSRGR